MSSDPLSEELRERMEWLKHKRFNCLCPKTDLMFAYRALEDLSHRLGRPLANMIEIGSYHGATLYLFSHFVSRGGTIVSVDLGRCMGPKRKGDHSKRTKRMIEYLKEQGYNAKLFLGNSEHLFEKVRDFVKSETIDFLHIDGGHDYYTVKFDFDHYTQLVGTGGLVLLHDVNNPQCTVPGFWGELRRKYGDAAFSSGDNWPGMGAVELGRGSSLL